jgi:hypothetical protein
MAEEAEPVIGMSIGATTLAAVTADRAITREPVLTLFGNGSSRIGAPAKSPADPEIEESGLVFTGFVDRVGDSAPVTASDGSTHRGEQVLTDALHALAGAATGGGPLPPVAVAYPAHWPATAVYALRTALSQVPEWSEQPAFLISDVAAALTALQANPGLPTKGIIAVCDFGGSGTSITLVDAAWGNQPVGATVRDTDFSGELIDEALLNYVMADLSADGSPDGGPAGQRDQGRTVKEQLSANAVTELKVDQPGFHGSVWVTRAELDGAIGQPLDGFLDTLQECLYRNRIPPDGLAAVAAVGGGANIQAIANGVSQRFGVEVISSPRPHLTAAIGAALGAGRRPGTPPVPTGHDTTRPEAPPLADDQAAPAWPLTEHSAGVVPTADAYPVSPDAAPTAPTAAQQLAPDKGGRGRITWNRGQLPLLVGVALAVLVAGIVAVVALRHASAGEPATPAPPTSTSTTAERPAPGPPASEPPAAPEPPVTTSESPAPEPPAAPVPGQPPPFPEVPGAPPVPEAPGP